MSGAVDEAELRRAELAPTGAIGRLDRAFVLVRAGGLGLAARAWAASAPLAALPIAIWYVERVEGVRALRPVLAIAIALAWAARAVGLGRVARAHVRRLWAEAAIPEDAGRASDVARAAAWTGAGLWGWAWLLVLGALAGPIGVALVLPLFALRGGVAPSWLARAACTREAGLRVLRGALADSAGQRVAGIGAELALIAGGLALFANFWGAVAIALLLGRSLLGLDLALIDGLLSWRNALVWIVLAVTAAWSLEPLRAALSAVTWVEARVRAEALDLRVAIDDAIAGAETRRAPRGARSGASAALAAAICVASALAPIDTLAQPPGAFPPPPLPDGFAPPSSVPDPDPAPGAVPAPGPDPEPAPDPGSVPDPVPVPVPDPDPVSDPASDARARAAAHDILARPEFDEYPDARGRGVRDALESLLEWLFRQRDPVELPRAPALAPIPLPGPLAFLAIAIALLVLVAIVLWVTRPLRRAPRAPVAGPLEGAADGAIDPRERAPDQWVDDAARLAAERRYREALRALYLATLVALDRARLIRFDPTRTNGHYLRALRRAEVRPYFLEFTRIFDRTWYGREEAGEAEYLACRAHAEKIVAGAREGAR